MCINDNVTVICTNTDDKKLYKSSGKCDEKQQYKAMIESAMVSNPEGSTYNSPISPRKYVSIKQPSARKILRQFT